jgi:diguanylate cyclase (GGDEF)-like protein/putative nucleotidyltransferase with HDIG domain
VTTRKENSEIEMSAIPSEARLESEVEPEETRQRPLPVRAQIYLMALTALAAAISIPAITQLEGSGPHHWRLFIVLVIATAGSHLFRSDPSSSTSFHPSWVFLIASVLLLPPELVAFMGVLMNIPEWLKYRYRWYIQTFNIANYSITCMIGWAVGAGILSLHGLIPNAEARWAVASLVVCVATVGTNHALLAEMLSLGRNKGLRETQLFSFESLSADFVLATLGVAVAAFWKLDPWLIPFAIVPVLLIHRALTVQKLQVEARVDAKTGLFNARHFATVFQEELNRSKRFQRPMSLIMADLDLLRDINNTYGHLAGDAVLRGIAKVFHQELRQYDVPARFGGEEFSILLPETPPEQAFEIAERIRRAVAAKFYEVETSSEPIRATISMGVASFPRDGSDANELVHAADVAVYRAKLQGRNRVLDATDEEKILAHPAEHTAPLVSLPAPPPATEPARPVALTVAQPVIPAPIRAGSAKSRPHTPPTPRFLSVPKRLALFVGLVGAGGTAAGVLGVVFGDSTDYVGLIVILALVGLGEALSLEVEETGSISVSAVGALMAAAIIGPRAALPLAITMSAVAWSARRASFHHNLFNVGSLSLATLAASGIFSLHFSGPVGTAVFVGSGLVAGAVYFIVNTSLLSLAVGLEGRENAFRVWKERFSWLTPHYVVYGFIAAVVYEAYQPIGAWAIIVFALPLFLMRRTQEAYLKHTQRSTQKLRQAAETIQTQNVSLEHANRLLKERSTAAMESLSATVDARDAYTAGHSRRVQQLALAIGRELNLSQAELELLGHAALFHDIGKLGIPDAILLKPSSLTNDEWVVMASHAEEGASIINRLGFLSDAVPAIRHHHERYDGRGYPDGLAGDDIPLGARIIHVADAFDSMLTTRVYRPARPAGEAVDELRNNAGKQFCPRCVAALEAVIADEFDTADEAVLAL